MTDESEQARSGITRRQAIGGAAAGAAGLALPDVATAREPRARRGRRRRSADVAIVGAGFAGLTAARELQKAGKSVLVLEAHERVGGRSFSPEIGEAPGEVGNMGATFAGTAQKRILALAREMGVGKFPTYNKGKNVFYFDGRRDTYTGSIPPVSPVALGELALLLPRLNEMARQVPLDAPYEAARANEWDGQTFETWKLANAANRDTRKLLDLAAEAILSVQPRDISFLFFLFYIHSAGSVEQLIDTAGGAQEFQFEGGTQLIANELAQRIGRKRILLGGRVQSITQKNGQVELLTRHHLVRAQRVIVAIPPTLAGRIAYKPRLPALRDQLTQRMPMGSVVKTIGVYDKPFWRDKGLTGMVTSDKGPVKVTFDTSPERGRPGVLMGFIDGQDARELTKKSDDERAKDVLASYATYFGGEALSPQQYFDRTWDTDIFSRGAPVGVFPPGVLTGFGSALRAPVELIHWAGTETATEWNGYMDGAVQSGERAAREVLGAL